MLNKGAFALEIVRGDPELTADCRVTLNRGDRIGSLDCRKTGVCRGIPNFLIFEPKHTLRVLVRVLTCTHSVCFELKHFQFLKLKKSLFIAWASFRNV